MANFNFGVAFNDGKTDFVVMPDEDIDAFILGQKAKSTKSKD